MSPVTSNPSASPAAPPAAIDSSLTSSAVPAASPGSLAGPRSKSVLPGGCPLWVVQRPGPEIVSAKLWIRGGSSSDPRGQRGSHQLLAGQPPANLEALRCGGVDIYFNELPHRVVQARCLLN